MAHRWQNASAMATTGCCSRTPGSSPTSCSSCSKPFPTTSGRSTGSGPARASLRGRRGSKGGCARRNRCCCPAYNRGMSTATDVQTLDNFIGGRWVKAHATEYFDVHNPALGEVIGRTPLSTAVDVDAAVQAAAAAFPRWRDTPVNTRAQVLHRLKALMEADFEELARTVTTEHGKTLDEARGSVRRGIECVEVACGAPSLMQGTGLEDISTGIDCHVVRQPLGVCAAIAPFNFPAMVPMWFLPFAIVTGNTFVLKPSEQVPLSQRRMAELLQQCDLP